MNNNTFIAGMGTYACIGQNVETFWNSVISGHVGTSKGFGEITTKSNKENKDRFALSMALISIDQAMKQAGWKELAPSDGIILATTTGAINNWETRLYQMHHKKINSIEFSKYLKYEPFGNFINELSNELNFYGRRIVISSACCASTQAIAVAHNWLQTKKVKRCLVVGVECLSDLTKNGFSSLKLIDTDTCRPFDQNRKGINLSEGSAAICLESNKTESKQYLAQVSGGGYYSEGYHMTSPHPEGKGCFQAIKMAMKQSKINAEDISWIHAHGTASISNDLSESKAINKYFRDCNPAVTSTKSLHGHALAASGIIESIICIKSILENQYIPNWHIKQKDENINLNLPTPPTLNKYTNKVRHVLKTTLGFGGMNAALVFSGVEKEQRTQG